MCVHECVCVCVCVCVHVCVYRYVVWVHVFLFTSPFIHTAYQTIVSGYGRVYGCMVQRTTEQIIKGLKEQVQKGGHSITGLKEQAMAEKG